MFFATVDMDFHTMQTPVDTSKQWQKQIENILHMKSLEGTYDQASFGHLMGYDAGYYGYMWSSVYAFDMFSLFEEKGILDEKSAKNTVSMCSHKAVQSLSKKCYVTSWEENPTTKRS
ncbi:MAG: M3 family metallopeptidase [Bdellovibrionota bacterium]